MGNTAKKSFTPGYRKPTDIAGLISQTLKAYRIDKEAEKYSIFRFWPEIVGDDLAEVTAPERITAGKILVVRVSSAIWAQELTMRKDEILQKFRSYEKGAHVEDVRFVVTGPKDVHPRRKSHA